MEKKTFYITTPIYYPSDKLHIGHSYCTVATDALARYKRMQGFDVMFLTGTDEHGQKIEQKAQAAGVTPKQYVDNIVSGIHDLWKLMNISHDRFIRTTDDYHEEAVQKIFKELYDRGDIYKGSYKGKYCTPCESFWTESQLVDGCCPDCGRPVVDAEEEAYFFKLSKYADRLLKLFTENPEFLTPDSRRNEMIAFINQGLEDLCVSRTSFSWGVPVTFDPKHVVYVLVDALSNYLTALGYQNDRYNEVDKYWPADIHIVGKEIIRFHTIIWPAMLMALDMPLPKRVYGHGWLVMGGDKMSKSKGNVVDPVVLCERYGVDSLRYFLLREFPFGSDGNFTNELLISRINSDLANDLGNLVSRSVSMIEKYFGGKLPVDRVHDALDDELIAMASALKEKCDTAMDNLAPQTALIEIMKVIARCNKYIDETAPWVLAKDEANTARLATVMYNLLETLRICAVLLAPFMPSTTEKIAAQIGLDLTKFGYETCGTFGMLPADTAVAKGEALFPRIDMKKELEYLEEQKQKAIAETKAEAKAEANAGERAEEKEEGAGLITIDDFAKVVLTPCKIKACEPVKKSDKLLKLQLDDGTETGRQVVSGIAKYYTPDQLIGKTVLVVANLTPVKLRGELSEGMILAAENKKGEVQVLFLEDSIEAGSHVS
ncbi:MAG: methionine--tRNA ligase [Oscillospiraceae bacterium]|nr:methionine--tRNA ligase [Oscillospiraceae bacterium]